MKELNLAIVRANERKRQIDDAISSFQKIDRILTNLTSMLENPGNYEINDIAEQFIAFSESISLLRARRGSAVMRHMNVPWKHLISLGQAIELVIDGPGDIAEDIISNIGQANEIKLLHDQIKTIITEEEYTREKVTEIITILEHERSILSPIREQIISRKDQLKHYRFIFNIVSSILSLKKTEQEKITQKIKELNLYIDQNSNTFPEYIREIFEKYPPTFENMQKRETLQNIKTLIETEKNHITEAIDFFKKRKKDIENGIIFRAPNIVSILVMIKIEYSHISSMQKANEISDAFKKIRTSLMETKINYYNEKNQNNEFIELLDTCLNPNHLITVLLGAKQEKISLIGDLISKTDNLINPHFLVEYNEALLKKVLEKFNEGWQGVKYYTPDGRKKKKKPEEIFNDYQKELQNLCACMQSPTSDTALDSKIEGIRKIIREMKKDTMEQSVREANTVILGEKYFLTLLISTNHTVANFIQTAEKAHSIRGNQEEYQKEIEELKKLFILLKFQFQSLTHTDLLQKGAEQFDKITQIISYVEAIQDHDFIFDAKHTQIKGDLINFPSLIREIVDANVDSLEKEEMTELDTFVKRLEKEAVKEIPSKEGFINIPCIFQFASYELDKKNLTMICKYIDCLITDRANLHKEGKISIIYKRAFFYALIVLGEAAKDISHAYKIEHPNIPWKLFNRIRNHIFHKCIDNAQNRKTFLSNSEITLIDACLNELLVCKEKIDGSLITLNELKKFGDIPVRTIRISDPEKNKEKNVERALLKIANSSQNQSDKEPGFDNFEVLHGNLSYLPKKEATDSIEITFSNSKFESMSYKKILLNQRANEKHSYEKESDDSIIVAFLEEIENLKSILSILEDPAIKDLFSESIISNSLEFSIAYIGELARLLKDSSLTFQSYASLALLQKLEDWIVMRGEIAHSRAIKVSSIDKATYNKIVQCDKVLLEIAKKIGKTLLFNLEKVEERCEVYRKKFSILEDAIGSNPKHFGAFVRIYQDLKKMQSLKGKETANLMEMLQFYTDEEALQELVELHGIVFEEKNNLIAYQSEVENKIRVLKDSIEETPIDDEIKIKELEKERENIQRYIGESVKDLALLEGEIEAYLKEEFEGRQYALEQIILLGKKITVSEEEKETLSKIAIEAQSVSLYSKVEELQEIKKSLCGAYRPESEEENFTLEEMISALNVFIKNSGVGTLLSEDFTGDVILAKLIELNKPESSVQENFTTNLDILSQEICTIMETIKVEFETLLEKESRNLIEISAQLESLSTEREPEFKRMVEDVQKIYKQREGQQEKYFAAIDKKLQSLNILIEKLKALKFTMTAMAESKDENHKDADPGISTSRDIPPNEIQTSLSVNDLSNEQMLPTSAKTLYNDVNSEHKDDKSVYYTHDKHHRLFKPEKKEAINSLEEKLDEKEPQQNINSPTNGGQ